MKKKSILSLVVLLAGMLFVSTSCSDMLTPDLERYSEKSAKDSLYSYLGILKSVQKFAERDVILGEVRSDLIAPTKYISDSVSQLYNFDIVRDGDNGFLRCADYYNVINQCNFYLHYVDTTLVKDESKYMLKEWAQVQAVRAWTYLQLVQNYGEVPFFTEPVSNSSLGKALEKSGQRVNKDNIADLLVNAGLERAYEVQHELGYPSYGSFNTGATSIAARSCYFPVALVMGDLYLVGNKYEEACDSYFKYIRWESPQMPSLRASFQESITQEGTRYIPSAGNWPDGYSGYSVNSGSDLITLIPSAGSKANGEVLTQVQNIYGFRTSSQGSGTSGSISISADEKYRQVAPSESYIALNAAQTYCNYKTSGGIEVQEFYEGVGDARFYPSAPLVRLESDDNLEDYYFIAKRTPSRIYYNWQNRKVYSSGFSSYYAIPVYRKSAVFLRFAEALNRAGFPQFAFSILKDGIATENYPELRFKDSVNYVINVDSTNIDSIVYDTLSIDTIKDVPYLSPISATTGGAYYVSLDEMLRAQSKKYLDFSLSVFNFKAENVIGIHGRGCGETRGERDSLYTYDLAVGAKIAANRLAAGTITREDSAALADSLGRVTIDSAVVAGTITSEEVTEAVEDLIIDELALETAFEGNRYFDLMRFANHKGNGTLDNEWLAKKIASRNYKWNEGYDASLYGRLVGGQRWYLPLPEDD